LLATTQNLLAGSPGQDVRRPRSGCTRLVDDVEADGKVLADEPPARKTSEQELSAADAAVKR